MRPTGLHLAVVAVFFALSACVTVPQITSEAEEKMKEELAAESKLWREKQQEKIERIAGQLLEATGTQAVIRFVFVATLDQTGSRIHPDIVNAWTDGSTVWVTRGMLRFLRTDDELAAVLAHEMGHALREHMKYLWAQNILGAAVTIPASVFGGRIGGTLSDWLVQLVNARFHRDQEREADLYGLIWAYRAGFDVDQGKEIFKRMAIEMPESTSRGFLATHPSPPERFLALDQIAATLKAGQDPLIVFGPQAEEAKPKEEKKEEGAAAGDDAAR